MSQAGEAVVEDAGEVCLLDPFAYQPGIGSRIAGLAAGVTGPDPNYVFHTDYIAAGRGHALAEMRFTNLSAREGTLMVRVHLWREDARPNLVLVTSERIAFNRLAQNGGELSLRFEVFNNCRYALYGSVLGNTDATADGLEITFHKATEAEETGFHTEARNSEHGQASARPSAMLVATEVPTLAGPVSQVATAAQLRSPEARAVLAEAGLSGRSATAEQWVLAYTVRALEAYGVLDGTARGLGFVREGDGIAELLSGRSVPVRCLYGRDGAPVLAPRDLANFDFLWQYEASRRVGSTQEWIEEIEQTLKALLPGGLGVLTFGYDARPPIEQPPAAFKSTHVVDRRDVERLALILISRGHEVAQLRIVGDYEPLVVEEGDAPSLAGLIVRRMRLAG